jgi:rhodanese-related sulfurtransferase
MRHWTPLELVEYLANTPRSLAILDVREPWEYAIAHIDGSILIPLGRLMQAMDELDASQEWLVVCHHGIRSAQACYFLERSGFKTINLTGGIERWARDVDCNMPLY